MKRYFDFNYYFVESDYKICFSNGLTKTDIEKTIISYINNYNIYSEDEFIINYNDDIEIYFEIIEIVDSEYSILVDNIHLTNRRY